ncbi:MAG: hypothetical protein WD069_17200 [Planctomycetales bacterium]
MRSLLHRLCVLLVIGGALCGGRLPGESAAGHPLATADSNDARRGDGADVEQAVSAGEAPDQPVAEIGRARPERFAAGRTSVSGSLAGPNGLASAPTARLGDVSAEASSRPAARHRNPPLRV